MNAYFDLVREVIQHCRELGADLVSVSLGTATSYQVEIRQQKIDMLKEAGSSGIHVALGKNKRRSSMSSNDLRMETLRPLLQSAMEAIPYMGEDEAFVLPDPKIQGRATADLNFKDEQLKNVSSQEKINRALNLEKITLEQDSRLSTEQAYYSDMGSFSIYADSNGFLDGYEKTLCSVGMSAFAEDQDQQGENKSRKQNDGWYSASRFYHDLEDNQVLAKKTAQRILRKLGAVKPLSQEVPVIFSAEMARSFLGSIASAMMGDNIFRKHSFLAGKLGELIANPLIRLEDNPLMPGKMGSRYFDSEGVMAKPILLIENGVLKNYMLSTYSANKLSMQTTGHAGGISNLVLQPGVYSEEELIASVKNGLYLTFMSGQGANITTGDYSRGGQGIWIRDGKLAEPVSEFTIASTFLEMLQNIAMIGKDPDDRGSIIAPPFKINRMSISGK